MHIFVWSSLAALLLVVVPDGGAATQRNQHYYDADIDDDETISFLETNPDVSIDGYPIVEGDIVVDPSEKSATSSLSRRWPLQIKYTLSPEVDADAVRAGLDFLVERTCLTFIEEEEGTLDEPHMKFVQGDGCYSLVGMSSRGSGQTVSIGANCHALKIVVHETMHALGFHHEQCRPDRDDHVLVLVENVESGKQGNFNKKSNDVDFSVPYDYTSAMHYRRTAFSENGLPTVVPLDIRFEDIIGKMGPSHNDLQAINAAYECASACSSGQCFNNGYLDSSCTCVCPEGTSGDQCEQVTGQYYPETCLHEISAEGTVESAGYPDEQVLGTCVYIITAPVGQTVRVNFTDFELKRRSRKSGKCKQDKLSVRYNSTYLNDEEGCGDEMQDHQIDSVENFMLLKHKVKTTNRRGFQAEITFV